MKRCSIAPLPKLSDDPYMAPFLDTMQRRSDLAAAAEQRLTEGRMSLADFASGHEYFGLHFIDGQWVFREWAPNASAISIIGQFSDWQENPDYSLTLIDSLNGTWECRLDADLLKHGDLYRLKMHWHGGSGDRIPAYARYTVQDPHTHIFNAVVWRPDEPYMWQNTPGIRHERPVIYESHVGMAQEDGKIGSYTEFEKEVLPRIKDAGYNTIQLMAVMEHPYYASFGYQVSSFFAASSRFGTPDELKSLVDTAHGMGIAIIMDLVHSHAVNNEAEGLSRFDGTEYQYFHRGDKGRHPAWDSRCFDYTKPQVLHFLLSNCRFWLDEYRFDGYRFDGITSMLYLHHGLGYTFTNYDDYFNDSVDEDAAAYLQLANRLIHEVKPGAITIAEDVSGMPGLGAPAEDSGTGFDYRLAMGVPDCWFKLVNDTMDEDWSINTIWHELTNKRADERTIGYAECHDQALVGGRTLAFEMMDVEMYNSMSVDSSNISVDRAMALHKMIRLATHAAADGGYLNFMGNEFGHPEWIDFPREGNGWSYHHARRQWSLRDNKDLKYHFLGDFDREMIDVCGDFPVGSVPQLMMKDEPRKLLVFARADLIFAFNFHSTQSLTDHAIEVLPGEYELVLDSDAPSFGGHDRIEPHQRYKTNEVRNGNSIQHCIKMYLPCRTSLVLKRI